MNKACQKCQGEMIKGRSRDLSHGAIFQERWVPDDKNLWFSEGVKVDSYACKKCGFIESYLQMNQDSKSSLE